MKLILEEWTKVELFFSIFLITKRVFTYLIFHSFLSQLADLVTLTNLCISTILLSTILTYELGHQRVKDQLGIYFLKLGLFKDRTVLKRMGKDRFFFYGIQIFLIVKRISIYFHIFTFPYFSLPLSKLIHFYNFT